MTMLRLLGLPFTLCGHGGFFRHGVMLRLGFGWRDDCCENILVHRIVPVHGHFCIATSTKRRRVPLRRTPTIQ